MDHVLSLKPRTAKLISAPAETAERCIGQISAGFRLIGFTKGQFSLLDLLRAILAQTGPADVCISTWTAGIRDADNVGMLHERGAIRSLRLLTDRSFPTRKPEYITAVRRAFGDDSIVVTHTHAKFALIGNEKFRIVVCSSMNLNRNPRFEQFTCEDDAELYGFVLAHVDDLFATSPRGLQISLDQVNAGFTAALGGGLSTIYELPSDETGAYPPGFLDRAD